ncbi:MAG: hypothetical protein CM15mP47_1100 [Methanobacteriota archaeon]|nr:MAG: hypothetical protein CM15mP47_1100 [Euryarchaeota archaeon]
MRKVIFTLFGESRTQKNNVHCLSPLKIQPFKGNPRPRGITGFMINLPGPTVIGHPDIDSQGNVHLLGRQYDERKFF